MISLIKPIIGKEEKQAVLAVLNSGMLAQGRRVKELEENFVKICRTKFAIATSSGTSALHTALHSLGIGNGDEVITTPFTFIATANSILMTGATPVFVDIEEDTYNIDPKLIEDKITKKTKAILAVDLYGQPADYKQINKIAQKNKLFVIEDAAQSIGAVYCGKNTGSLGDVACFSLYASKNIISGEGGMITTNKKYINHNARLFRHHGQSEEIKYSYFGLGFNYRMTDIQAAIAIEQLKRLEFITKRRQEIARKYDVNFQDLKGLISPKVRKNQTSAYHQYTLRITDDFKINRNELKKYLEKKGIQSNVYYPTPLYKVNHLTYDTKPKDFPVTEKISKEVLSIPIHTLLTDRDIRHIIDTIKKI